MRTIACYCSTVLMLIHGVALAQNFSPRLYTVQASAAVERSPASIRLEWPADSNADQYTVSRKAGGAWSLLATLPGSAVAYTDVNVQTGLGYEYQILKTTSLGYRGSGYVYSGIDLPVVEDRGKIILLVDATWTAPLEAELRRLQFDLVGDGWTVLRYDVSPGAPVPSVKNIVRAAYNPDPARVRALFLFGHIPVPYSGDYAADSHDNHRGAWPADVYYGDVDGVWTDSTVNRSTAEKSWNWNVPGDGKFDQSVLPSDVELEVGRVDLSNMTCFSNKTPSRDELALLRQYLNKDHRFRHGELPLPRRGLVIDNFGGDKEALASTGWRNFAPLFGAANATQIEWGTFFPTLASQGYLWSYGTGGGAYYTCAGVGSSDDFALNDIRTVFTFFFGSYYGDWNNESNFLRAPLGSTTYTLTSAWGGRPHWFMHHMALGGTIGYSTRLTQNNAGLGEYEPDNFGQREVHTALLGDPTLRLHPVIPPQNLTVTPGSGASLSWSASTDGNITGYLVYRASSEFGPYARISGASPVTSTAYSDPAGAAGSFYMVRAIKWEASASGTYYNLSQGIFAAADSGGGPPAGDPSAAVFAGADWTSRGAWKPHYGSDGWMIVQHSTNLPAYAGVTRGGGNPWTWETTTVSLNSLQRVADPLRTATCWYTPTAMNIGLNLRDGAAHRVAIYLMDVSSNQRVQTVEVLGADGAVLDSRSVSRFYDGVYLVWDLQGTVTVRVTRTGGANAVICGIFFGSSGIESPPAMARFAGVNTAAQGTWRGAFGSEGNRIVADTPKPPAFAAIAPNAYSEWVWDYSTGDTRALERNDVATRMATCWYSGGSFEVEIALPEGQAHAVALYCLDWDFGARRQRVDLIDPASGAVLDSRTLSGFSGGVYLNCEMSGRITVRFTRLNGPNAVLSGIFFDPAP